MEGIIYGIKEISSGEIIYIGSTNNLSKRKSLHKHDCFTMPKNRLICNYIRERTDREHFDENFSFEELYTNEFESKEELRMIEEKFIKEKMPCCNQIKAFRSEEELREYIKKYHREYQKTDKQREYHREYQKTDKIREYKREYLRNWRNNKKKTT